MRFVTDIYKKRETLINHEVSDRPWEKVGIDLMEIGKTQFLVTVDYYSNYWEVDEMKSVTATAIIRTFKAHFAKYGTPSAVISDNGPQFVNEEFINFTESWDFHHYTRGPGNPKANGQVESAAKHI